MDDSQPCLCNTIHLHIRRSWVTLEHSWHAGSREAFAYRLHSDPIMTDRIAAEYGAAIRDFKATMQRFTEEAACGRRYVLVTKLKEWLRSKVRPDSNLTHVGCLLRGAYHGRSKKQPGLPVDLEQFQSDDNCRLVMFSILLELDRGALVDRFQRQNIVDAQLPINLQSLQEKLETLHISDAEELAAKFNDLQWRFCAAKLDLNMSWDHKREMTIPIHNKEKINSKGGTATLWQIEVREEFVSDRLRQAVLSSRYGDPPDAVSWYAFVLAQTRLLIARFAIL